MFKVYNWINFVHQHNQENEHIHPPQEFPPALLIFPRDPGTTDLPSLVAFSRILCKWEPTVGTLFCLASLTQHNYDCYL